MYANMLTQPCQILCVVSVLGITSRAHPLEECPSHRLATRADRNSSGLYQTRFSNVTWDHANWRLTTTNLDQGHFQSRMTVANGYHGINVAALGPFFEYDTPVDGDDINGWPLFDRRQTFATIGNFWDAQPSTNGTNFPWLSQYGWDSVISGIPHWGGIVLDVGNSEALHASTDASSIRNFASTLDMKQGLMNWAFTWESSVASFDVTYQMFAHKVQVNQGFVRMTVSSQSNVNVTVVNVLNGDCALRTNPVDKGLDGDTIYSAVSPVGVSNVTGYVYANLFISGTSARSNSSEWTASYVGNNQSSIAAASSISLDAGQSVSLFKYVGIASSDAFPQPQDVARGASSAAAQTGYDAALSTHVAEWAALFPSTSVDDFTYPKNGTLPNDTYIVESAITAVTNPYYILQNTISLNATLAVNNTSINSHSVSVGGLGSDSYAGQIFWDAEVWMQPGIAAAFPYAALGIANYRNKLHGQAIANTQTAYQSSKNQTNFTSGAAVYPWTSGRYGNCTATGPCFDYEYHLNGDIVLALTLQWLSSGDSNFLENQLYPIHDSVATLYSQLLQPNGSYFTLTNMTDPDEYANHVDNGGYTMPLIASTLLNANALHERFGQAANDTWNQQAQNVYIETDNAANVILEYTGPTPMNGTIEVKQADVVLVTYPLDYSNDNYTSTDALSNLNYYANKQSSDGPGMTYAIFSIVANEVSLSGCSAYTYQQYSYSPYARAPWFQLSEQLSDDYTTNGGTHPAYPFLTGHGGANQVILFGYLGLRYVADGNLYIDPSLPPQIPNLRYRTFYWQGWPIQAVSNQTHTSLTLSSVSNPAHGATPNSTFTNSSIPVVVGPSGGQQQTFQLSLDSPLTIQNRVYYQNKTIPGNIAQCQLATSKEDFVPGQFPFAIVDGANSTKWQPAQANQSASVTIMLPFGYVVESFEFNWGAAPPYNYSVSFHNESAVLAQDTSAKVIASSNQVNISNPYDTADVLAVAPVSSNTTVVMLNDTSPSNQAGSAIFTATYATLTIWGSQVDGSMTESNMTGPGATVAEWAIIVADNNLTSSSSQYEDLEERGYIKRSGSSSNMRANSMLHSNEQYNSYRRRMNNVR